MILDKRIIVVNNDIVFQMFHIPTKAFTSASLLAGGDAAEAVVAGRLV